MFCKSYALSLRKILCLCYISSRDTTPTKFDSMCLPCFSYQLPLFLACLKVYISCTHQTSLTRIGPCLFMCLVQSDSYWNPLINLGTSRIFYVVSMQLLKAINCGFWFIYIYHYINLACAATNEIGFGPSGKSIPDLVHQILWSLPFHNMMILFTQKFYHIYSISLTDRLSSTVRLMTSFFSS